MRLEVLGPQHRLLLREFANQHPSLVDYLRRFALRHASRDLLSRTHLAIDTDGGRDRLAGYFSLAATSVARERIESIAALSRLPRFPIPAVLLARLAVDSRVQGQGLGTYLFEQAFGMTLAFARSGPVAFRLLVTDAIDHHARSFYERFGLIALSDVHPCRMILDLAPFLVAPRK
jgi:GNAT superfamily N-acetyltransferase